MADKLNFLDIAEKQAEEDRKTAAEQTAANRPTQTDSFGNKIEWTKDAAGNWTQNTSYAAPVQEQFAGQVNNANNATNLQGGLIDQLRGQSALSQPDMPTYDENSGKAVSDATYGLLTDRLIPQQQKDQQSMTNKLRLQGLQPGTRAFDDALQNMMRSHGDVLTGAANTATVSGYNEARERYLAQLRGQNQDFSQKGMVHQQLWQDAGNAGAMAADRYNPSFPKFTGATGYEGVDYAGAAGAESLRQQAKDNNKADWINNIFDIGGNILDAF